VTRGSQFLICASLVLVALVVAAPLWGPGMVNTRGGGDSPFLLQRAHQMVINLRAGVFPVRWMPDAAYGLGYPFFSYYSALPYYLVGLLALLGLDLLTALKLVQTLGFVAASLAMYGWVHGFTRNRWAAWLAAVAYTVAPFHLVNVYVRGDSLSEFYAFIFYPLILWTIDGIDGIGNTRLSHAKFEDVASLTQPAFALPDAVYPRPPVVAAALAYAGLILSHNISAFLFSPFVLLYLGVSGLRATRLRATRLRATRLRQWNSVGSAQGWRAFGAGALALGLGLLLSAWAWVPALAEMEAVQTGTLTGGYFHYTHHFRTLDLIQPRILFDYDVTVGGNTPFAMGLPQAVFAMLGGLVLAVRGLMRGRLEARWGFALLGLLLSTVLITPLSSLAWEYLPLLSMAQFPWRFLSVQAFFAATVTAALVPLGRAEGRPSSLPLAGRVEAGIAVSIAVLLAASVLIPLRPERLFIDAGGVTVERLQVYELFTQNIGTTIGHEWLPRAVVPRPFTSEALIEPGAFPEPIPLAGTSKHRFGSESVGNLQALSVRGAGLEATLVAREPTRQVWRISSEGGSVAFPLLYWPGWRARVDGSPVEVWPVEGSGYLALEVPSGDHTVLLRLGRTPVRAGAEVVSLVAVLALLVFIVKVQIQGSVLQVSEFKRFMAYSFLLILPLLVLSLLQCTVFEGVASPLGERKFTPALEGETDLTMDFDLMPYLHHNPGGVSFGDGRLAGYQLSAEELAPGDTLTVTLDWSGGREAYTATVRLLSPAAVRHEVEPLAEAACNLPAGNRPSVGSTLALRLPEDIPRGVYLLQLLVFPYKGGDSGSIRALTPGGRERGPLYLRPVRVTPGPSLPSEIAVLASFGPSAGDVIRLHAANIHSRRGCSETAAQRSDVSEATSALEEGAARPLPSEATSAEGLAPGRLGVQLDWSVTRPVAANYAISLRLVDAGGQHRVSLDTQPGYGFLPTSLWRPGELIVDRYVLSLPDDLPCGGGYRLQVVLYQVSTLEPIGQAWVGDFELPLERPFEAQPMSRVFVLPSLQHPLDVRFAQEVQLAGYDLERGEGALVLTLWWRALRAPQADYTVFVHLFDPETEGIAVQNDAQPRGGMYPTSWWAEGEVVSETVVLPLEGVAQGEYRLAVGLYDRTMTRLQAVDSGGLRSDDGLRLPGDRMILPESVEVRHF